MKPNRDRDITIANATAAKSRNIVVIGGSAGAFDVMIEIAKTLPKDYSGSIFVVSHIGVHPSQLPELLTRAGLVPAHHARHEEHIRPGHIYVAPPDRHLLLSDSQTLLSALPREHFTRPAIDPLFRSAAATYGSRVIGVLLSGTGSDGTLGLQEISKVGGVAVVQDPEDAAFPEMPETAIYAASPDHVVAGAQIVPLLLRLAEEPLAVSETKELNVTGEMDLEAPFALTCPECGGAVREVPGGNLVAYRCHTGHRFTGDELLVRQVEDLERAIMIAIRVLRERTTLCRRMIGNAKAGGRTYGVAYWSKLNREADDQLKVLERFLKIAPVKEEDEKTANEAEESLE